MNDCIFCRIASHRADAVRLYEDEHVMAFLDRHPIRPGHTQIILKAHVPYFDDLSPEDAGRLLQLGQRLARRMKVIYRVERVAFAFSGGDVPHVHAHVFPIHEKTDISSARHLVAPPDAAVRFESGHLLVEPAELERVRDELAFGDRCL